MSDAMTMLTGPDMISSILTKIALSTKPITTLSSNKDGEPDIHSNPARPLNLKFNIMDFVNNWTTAAIIKPVYKENDAGTEIRVFSFSDFLHPGLLGMMNYVVYFRFDIDVRIQTTTNMQDIGFARIVQFPFDWKNNNTYYKWFCKDDSLNSYRWCLVPYGSSNTIRLTLKWLTPRPYDLLNHLEVGNSSFGIYNYCSLNLNAASFLPQFTVEYKLVNLQVAGPYIKNQ